MTKPRNLVLAIATTALAFAAALGSVVFDPIADSSTGAEIAAPRQVALFAVRHDPSTPVQVDSSGAVGERVAGPTTVDLR